MEDVVPTTAKWNWNEYTPEWVEELIEKTAQPPIMGYMVWTRQNHGEDEVREYIEALTRRQIPYLRTGLSWAEWVDPQGREWIKWYMGEYARHFDVLPCLTFTPPEYAVLPKNMVNLPPSDPSLYAAFVHEAIEECGAFFNTLLTLSALPSSISRISFLISINASQKRSSSSCGSLSVGSIINVPATGKETVGAWKP